MKKICIFITLTFFFLSQTYAQGETNCAIENGPSEELVQYIQNNRQVIINLKNTISENIKTQSGQTNLSQLKEKAIQDGKKVARIYNTLSSWNGYFSYFDYYILFPILNDVPAEVKRDHTLLTQEGEGLNNYLQNVIIKGYGDIVVTKEQACGVLLKNPEITCEIQGSVSSIMGQLISNHSKVIDIYRQTVMNEDVESQNLILVNNSEFLPKIVANYSPSLNQCAEKKRQDALNGKTPEEKQSFSQKVTTFIKKITYNNDSAKVGIQAWKDAIDLATGINTDKEKEIEKQLLIAELSRQGIPGNGADAMVANLEKYNNESGPSLRNNFLTNSVVSIWDNVTNEFEKFNTDVIQDFKKKREKNSAKETLSIQGLQSQQNENERKAKIASKIAELYLTQLPFTQISNNSVDTLKSRIIKLHNNLNQSIQLLDETAKISVKVCNSQASGEGKCDTK